MSASGRRLVAAVVAAAAVGVGVPGCFAIADLDRFHAQPDASSASDGGVVGEGGVDDPTKPSTLVLTLTNMGVHFQQYIEARVIDRENAIQCRIMIKPLDKLGSQQITIHAPGAIPTANQPYRLDFFADVNKSGGFDGIGNVLTNDHAWRIEPLADYPAQTFPHVSNEVQVSFVHNTSFTDIDKWPTPSEQAPPHDTGLSARVAFRAAPLAAYQGRLLELRIVDARSRHTVGLFRVPELPAADFVADLPGVLDDGFDYDLEIYIDANGNKQYDDPALASGTSDLAYQIPMRSGVDAGALDAGGDAGSGAVYGIDTVFDLSTTAQLGNFSFGEP